MALSSVFIGVSDFSFYSTPLILWVFFSHYIDFDSNYSAAIKFFLLMLPTSIWIFDLKFNFHLSQNNGANPDFNFVDDEGMGLLHSINFGVALLVLLIVTISVDTFYDPRDYFDGARHNKKYRNIYRKINFGLSKLAETLFSNTVYLILVNLYVVAIHVNLINFSMLLFFLVIILTNRVSKKMSLLLLTLN